MDELRNFSKVEISGFYNSSDSIITLTTDNINLLPISGSGNFNAVWYNATDYPRVFSDPNKEIIRCTGRAGNNTIYVIRGFEGAASAKNTAGKTYKWNVLPSAQTFNQSFYVANPRQNFYYYSDFFNSYSTGNQDLGGWRFTGNSGILASTGDFGHPGVITLELPIGSGASFFGQYGSGAFDFAAGGNYVYETVLRLDGLPQNDKTFSNKFGICDNVDNAQNINNGFSISYDQSGGFLCVVATQGSRISGLINVTPTTGWTKFKVTYNSNSETVFFVNGVSGLALDKPNNHLSSPATINYNVFRIT